MGARRGVEDTGVFPAAIATCCTMRLGDGKKKRKKNQVKACWQSCSSRRMKCCRFKRSRLTTEASGLPHTYLTPPPPLCVRVCSSRQERQGLSGNGHITAAPCTGMYTCRQAAESTPRRSDPCCVRAHVPPPKKEKRSGLGSSSPPAPPLLLSRLPRWWEARTRGGRKREGMRC